MKTRRNRVGLLAGKDWSCPVLIGLTVLLSAIVGLAQDQPLKELRTAEEIRRLSAEQASKHYPVHLKGVVTVYDPSLFSRFLQDETAGIYFLELSGGPPLSPGQLVEVEGETSAGEYAPIVVPRQIRVIGTASLPVAKPVTFQQLASGQEDSQFVEIHGIVRTAVTIDEQSKHQVIEIATGSGRLMANVQDLKLPLQDLVDSTVRVRGVCVTLFNRQRQLFHVRVVAPSAEDIVIEKPATEDPFSLPAQTIDSLLQFNPQGTVGHRVKVIGTVVYRQPDSALYIQDDKEGLYVQTQQQGRLLVGDRVEVSGFPAKGEYTPMLEDAIYRKIGADPLPVAPLISANEALKGTYDCRLVKMEATLLERARHSREQFMVLQAGGFIFHAYLPRKEGGTDFAYLQNGSKVTVTGVCLIEPGTDWRAGEDWRAKSFRILLRSPGDIFVLQRPSWWTLGKMLWMVGLLGIIVLGAFAWVANLRRRVNAQTKIIRQKLQAEATLKERYEDLFENANDMVYTHDLKGRITSVNTTGEKLLQRSRSKILGKTLLEYIAEEQEGAAANWMEQVIKGEAPPTAEWDFISASGQRIKLEISTRLIEQEGKKVEVEGMARDITERKRLEREILEISNREQRRIGHDLHDGVCQQLAGIAFMTSTLAEKLQEKGEAESAQVERISGLLNTAINQTRSVARGLFPVRLEENGLVSALEELAANAGDLFKISCRFVSEEPPVSVDNGIALHLYYIAQEAVTNAAKHAKAQNVFITLEPVKGGRYELTVKDDGVGLAIPEKAHPGMGIRIMHYRARVIGATLSLKSKPGSGTQVSCLFFPVSRELQQNGKQHNIQE
ncbi:PAS domain S-box protein [Pedosphaera parvula]|nr:PAS domain S-box protein [Pedosphaera parvula]